MLKRLIRRFTETISEKILIDQQKVIQRFEAESSKFLYESDPTDQGSPLGEYGFRVKGPEPTRYGDWERKGRVSDF